MTRSGNVQTSPANLVRVTKNRKLILPAVIVGVLLLIVAAIYLLEPAKSLPSFFPGHQAGSSHHHAKHAIAAIIVGLGAFVIAWFQTGPSSTSRRPTVS